MYRPPGRESHINITDAFDEIFNRLDLIEARLNNMELENAKTNANEVLYKQGSIRNNDANYNS